MPKLVVNTRKEKRIKASYLIKYQTGNKNNITRLSNARNVSAGGLCFLTNECLKPETLIRLAILIPSFESPIEVEARVLRVTRIYHRNMAFSVGVKFVEMSEENRHTLEKFIKQTLAEDHIFPMFVDLPNLAIRR